jgi:hypothetical protein
MRLRTLLGRQSAHCAGALAHCAKVLWRVFGVPNHLDAVCIALPIFLALTLGVVVPLAMSSLEPWNWQKVLSVGGVGFGTSMGLLYVVLKIIDLCSWLKED